MRKFTYRPVHYFLTVFLLALASHNHVFASGKLEQIKQAITEKGARWIAGENWVTRLSLEEQKQLCGGRLPKIDPVKVKLFSLPRLVSAPPVFDWRDNNGNWMTAVKNQGWKTHLMNFTCGSCWDFAAVAAIEAWWKIHYTNPDSQIDLSEQFILSCGELDCWSGGSVDYAYDFAQTMGVPTEACFPYLANDKIPCNSACSNWQQEAVTIPGWGYVTLGEANVENIKSALLRRPVAAYLDTYQDFLYYQDGVYEHVWGGILYGHWIVIIGWNDSEQSWICKNSFGSSWGDKGYFRIKWGECEIGTYCPYIWDNLTGGAVLTTNPIKFDLTLVSGDSLVESLTIHNLGTDPLEYSTLDCGGKAYFHPDSFMSYDVLSWWCGDPQIGGYQNSWLQFLDTPALDLTITNQPRLLCMSYWAVEDTTGISDNSLYDGWDGCNVFISTDGGITFAVAEPIKPQYTSRSLYSFGGLWGMGESIPGWGGSSGGWQEIEFDLSSYRNDSVVVRFAFASDGGVATPDNYALHGFFVDDIIITDAGTVLFEDNGNDASHMFPHGVNLNPVDWMEMVGASGRLAGGESAEAQLMIGTRGLESGEYRGRLIILSNDTTAFMVSVPVELQVLRPSYDVEVQSLGLPCDSIPLFVSIKPSAKILNCGQNDGADFAVTCGILRDGQAIYNDTTHVPLLIADQTRIVEFKPFVVCQKADLDFIVTILNFPNDYNAYNNRIQSTVGVTNLVDDYEKESGYWMYEGGWGITPRFGGHSGSRGKVHNNHGTTPYENNMDARMTFMPGFHFQSGDSALFSYWVIYITELNKDICYLELSTDSLTWIKVDSVSGKNQKWTQRQVSLTDLIAAGHTTIWPRFHFISDGQNADIGVLIDDVGIDRESPVTKVPELIVVKPNQSKLSQSYPNPFNPSTTIAYDLPREGHVRLVVYDLLGRHIKNLVDKEQAAGHFQTSWDGKDERDVPAAAGIYFCRMEAGDYVQVIKLALVK